MIEVLKEEIKKPLRKPKNTAPPTPAPAPSTQPRIQDMEESQTLKIQWKKEIYQSKKIVNLKTPKTKHLRRLGHYGKTKLKNKSNSGRRILWGSFPSCFLIGSMKRAEVNRWVKI